MQGALSVALITGVTRFRSLCVLQIGRYISHSLRQVLLALALLAAGTQAALPQGYMLDRDGQDGFVSVVFCSAGLGGQSRWLNLSTGEIEERETSADTSESCTFAAAHSAALPAEATHEPSQIDDRAAISLRTTGLAATEFAHIRPPARAPPQTL